MIAVVRSTPLLIPRKAFRAVVINDAGDEVGTLKFNTTRTKAHEAARQWNDQASADS